MYRIRKDGDRYFYKEKIKTMVDEFGNEEKAKVNVTTDNEWSPRCRFELGNSFLEKHMTFMKCYFSTKQIQNPRLPTIAFVLWQNPGEG